MDSSKNPDKKRFYNALTIPIVLTSLIILCFVLEKGMDWDFHSAGILPRHTGSPWSIVTHIFVHGDWQHLLNNCSSLLILTTALYYFYPPIATRTLVLASIITGILLWIIGRNSWHIGASGLIYALSFFLFTSGVLRKHIPLIAISLFIVFWYGSMVWAIFPQTTAAGVSWEGHLSGAITGITLAFVFRKKGPQKPIKVWEEEEEEYEYEIEEFEEEIREEKEKEETP